VEEGKAVREGEAVVVKTPQGALTIENEGTPDVPTIRVEIGPPVKRVEPAVPAEVEEPAPPTVPVESAIPTEGPGAPGEYKQPALPGGIAPPQPPAPPPPINPAIQPMDDNQWELIRRAQEQLAANPELFDWWTSVKSRLLDRYAVAKRLQKETNIPIWQTMQLIPGQFGATEALWRTQLLPVLKEVHNFLRDYLVARHMEDLITKFGDKYLLPEGVTDPRDALAEMEAATPSEEWRRIRAAAERIWQVNRTELVDFARDAGWITEDAAETMETDYPHYVPFWRQGWEPDEYFTLMRRPRAHLATKFSQYISEEGSVRRIQDPLESWFKAFVDTRVKVARNRGAKQMVAAIRRYGQQQGALFVRDEKPKAPGWEKVSYYEEGKRKDFYVPDVFARLAKGMDELNLGLLEAFARRIAQPMRLGATKYNPLFPIINYFRDATTVWMTEGIAPFAPTYVRAMWQALTHGESWLKAAKAGSFAGSIFDIETRPEDIAAWRLGGLHVDSIGDALKLVPRLIADLNRAVEEGARLAVWMKYAKRGMLDEEAAMHVAHSTIDFDQSGTWARVANQVWPFINARIQGTYRLAQLAKEKPALFVLRSLPFLAAAGLLFLWNRTRKGYEQIPDYEFANNWVIIVGYGQQERDPRYPAQEGREFPIYIKIPKGEMAATLTAVPEAVLRWAWDHDDKTLIDVILEATGTAIKTLSPVDQSTILGPGWGTAVQLMANRDFWRQSEIVPEREMTRPPEERYDESTSKTAVALGQAFHVSPRYIDFAIGDVFAGAGQTFNWVVDQALQGLGYNPVPPGVARERALTRFEGIAEETPVGRFFGTRATRDLRTGYAALDDAVEEARRLFYENEEFRRLGKGVNPPGNTTTIDGVPYEISPDQRVRIVELSAPLEKDAIDQLVETPEYLEMHDIMRSKEIDRVREQVRSGIREYVLAGIPAAETGFLAPPRVRGLYEEYRAMPEYRTMLWDPQTNAPRYLSVSREQYYRGREARNAINDLRNATGLEKNQAVLLYCQLTGDWVGALLSLLTIRQNPDRSSFWTAHPELERYYERREESEIYPYTPSPTSQWAEAAMS